MINGDGMQTRDFTFVRDTVEAIVKLSEKDELCGRTLNIGSGREASINEIIDEVCSATGYVGQIIRQRLEWRM